MGFFRKEFTVVPTGDENLKNKSPVLYEENNLGLESWCIKSIYGYAYSELLESRRKKLSPEELNNLNHLLIGALLINPDIYTFWNTKRDLVEQEVLNVDREFVFSKLVLSHKSKSNEAFAYRRWLITRILNKFSSVTLNDALIRRELEVTDVAAEKSPNNYHAWNHRMWAFDIISKNHQLAKSFIVSELRVNCKWVFSHVSEHVGYHYRQFLLNQIKTYCHSFIEFDEYYSAVKKFLESNDNINYLIVLGELLGPWDGVNGNAVSCVNYFSVLLYDLFYTLDSLHRTFPDHESVWYYRRSVIHHIVVEIYEVLGVKWKSYRNVSGGGCTSEKGNFVEDLIHKDDSGEKLPKLFKYEPNKAELTLLYTILVKFERNFLSTNFCSGGSTLSATYAKRHKKWLQYVMEMYGL